MLLHLGSATGHASKSARGGAHQEALDQVSQLLQGGQGQDFKGAGKGTEAYEHSKQPCMAELQLVTWRMGRPPGPACPADLAKVGWELEVCGADGPEHGHAVLLQ